MTASSAVEIPLTRGAITLVDPEDASLIEPYAWHMHPGHNTAYAATTYRKSNGQPALVLMHRLLLDPPEDALVDHRDCDGLNNRRQNLRTCTYVQNGANRRLCVRNTSGFKGVHWQKRDGSWVAYIRMDGMKRHLGYYSDPWDAAQAYNRAALAIWGEFARLNTQENA